MKKTAYGGALNDRKYDPSDPDSSLPAEPKLEFPAETIANAVVEVAEGMKRLNSTRLTREAIVVLIQAKSGIPKKKIEIVLNNLEQLEETWLKKKKKP